MRMISEDDIIWEDTQPKQQGYQLLSDDNIVFDDPPIGDSEKTETKPSSWGDILSATGKKVPHAIAQAVAGLMQAQATGATSKAIPDSVPFLPQHLKDIARAGFEKAYDYGEQLVGGKPKSEKVVSEYAEYGKAAAEERAKIHSQLNLDDNSIKYHAANILDSISMNAPGMLLGLATRQKAFVLTPIGLQNYGQEFDENLRAGLSPADSHNRALVSTASEVYTEQLTFKALSAIGKSFLSRLASTTGTEVAGEQINTINNAILQKTGRKPDYTVGDYLKDARDTFFATIGQSGAMTTAAHPIVKMQERGGVKAQQAREATLQTEEEAFNELDRIGIEHNGVDERVEFLEQRLAQEEQLKQSATDIDLLTEELQLLEQVTAKVSTFPKLLQSMFNTRKAYYQGDGMVEKEATLKAYEDISNTVLGQQVIDKYELEGLRGQFEEIESAKEVENTWQEVLPEDIVEVLPEDIVEVLPEDIVEVLPEDIVEALPEDIVEALPEDIVEALPEDIVEQQLVEGQVVNQEVKEAETQEAIASQETTLVEPQGVPIAEVKKISKKVKEEAVEILPRKKEILSEIKEAIDNAPTAEQYKDEKGKNKFPDSVKLEINGGLTVINTKEALTEVAKRIKALPKSLESKKSAATKTSDYSPRARTLENIEELESFEDKDISGDKSFIIKAKGIPLKGKKSKSERTVSKEKTDPFLAAPTTPAKLTYYFIETEEEKGVSDKPIYSKEAMPIVVFQHKNKLVAVEQGYVNAVLNRYPDATFGINEDKDILIAYDKGKPVAVIAALRPKNLLDNQAIEAGLLDAKFAIKDASPETKAFEGQEGYVNLSSITQAIKAVNPFTANKMEAAGIKVADAKKVLTGEKGIAAKLWSIPFWVGKKWAEFGKVFKAVHNSINEASETVSYAKEIFSDGIKKVIQGNDKLTQAVYEGMERATIKHSPTVDGLVASGEITAEEAGTFKEIDEKMPPLSRRAGAVISEIEYLDKNIYEKLLGIAAKLGVNHRRVINVGRNRLGYATPTEIVTQYATELDVLAHEIGHVIDFKHNLWDVFSKGNSKELRALVDLKIEGLPELIGTAYHKYTRKRAEKMATLTQAYIHAPEKFKQVAPNLYEQFDSFVKGDTILKDLADIKHGIAKTTNSLFRQGDIYKILKTMDNDKAATYVKVLTATTNWTENKQDLIDRGIPVSEIAEQGGIGAKWTDAELRDKGLNDKEVNAYNDMYEAVEKYGTEQYIDGRKWRAGFYKDIDPLQKALLEMQTRNAVKQYGAYLPIMRFGDYFVRYENQSGAMQVTPFEKLSEAVAFKNSLTGNAEIVNIKDENRRKMLFPHMTLHQLDMLIDNANVSMADSEIREIRELLLAKLGNVRSIKRQWTPGYLRTPDNLIQTVESYIDSSVRYRAKQKANAVAMEEINKIDNSDLKAYALRYLEAFNQSAADMKAFELIRNTAATIYLSLKPAYGIGNLTSQITTTLPRIIKDKGVLGGAKIWTEARLLASKYYCYSLEKSLDQGISGIGFLEKSLGFDISRFELDNKDLMQYLDKLKRQNVIRGTLTNELLDLRDGIKTMQGTDVVADKAKQAIGIVGNLTERDNRLHAAIAGYLAKKDLGLSESQMIDNMKDYIGATQWWYERINIPVKMKEIDKQVGGALRTAWLFQSWTHNYLSMLAAYGRGAAKGNAGDMKALVTAVIALASLTGIKGLPLASLVAAVYALSTGEPPDRQLREALGKENKKVADMILYGPVSAMTGADLSSMIGVGRFPGLNYEKLAATGEIDPETAVGGLWNRAKIAKVHLENERYWAAASLILDSSKNYQMATKWEEEKAFRKLSGERLGEETPSESDILLKKLSFPVLKVSKEYEKQAADKLIAKRSGQEKDKYADMLAESIYKNDAERRKEILLEIKKRKLDVTSQMVDERMKRIMKGKPDTSYNKDVRRRIHEGRKLY